jgi:hypothetical protein
MIRLLAIGCIVGMLCASQSSDAQGLGSLRAAGDITIPAKPVKLVRDPLPAGVYTIGTGGYFPSIDSAFRRLSTDGVAGEVFLVLTDSVYTAPTDSFGFLLNGPIPGAGPGSRITLGRQRPGEVLVQGSGRAVFTFVNTRYFTLDGAGPHGSPGGVTVHALSNPAYSYNACLDYLNDCDWNIVRKLILISDAVTRVWSDGVGFYALAGSPGVPDSNLIEENIIRSAAPAIYVSAWGMYAPARGNIVRRNQIGSESDSLISWGIQLEFNQGAVVEENTVQNIRQQFSMSIITPGINFYGGSRGIIRNNVVRTVRSHLFWGSTGILLSGAGDVGYGTDHLVYNNMVYDVESASPHWESRVAGIQMWWQRNPKIYHNTVHLSGYGANRAGSAALYVADDVAGLQAKNNILVNTRYEATFCASAIYALFGGNLTSDFNALLSSPAHSNALVRIGGTVYRTLPEWQVTGRDLHSACEMPAFVTPDLHIDETVPTCLESRGTPLADVPVDFDGQDRSTTAPDIGADEINGIPISESACWYPQTSGLPSGVFPVNLSALDSRVCWGVAQRFPANTAPYAGFLRTIDGGNIWVCDTIPGAVNVYLDEIFALDADTAYVTCYKLQGTTGTQGVYKTTDGGQTWSRQNAYAASQTGPAYIHFFDAQRGVVIGDYLETYTTTNGGNAWTPVAMPAPLPDEWTWVGESRFSVAGTTIWFCTNYGRVFKSTDRGFSWLILLSETQYANWLPSIAFQDSLTGIYALKAAGEGTDHVVRRTTDGGATWMPLSDPMLESIAPSTIKYVPGTAATYVLVGGRAQAKRGTVVTHDGGGSWTLADTVGCYIADFASSVAGWGSRWGTNEVYRYAGTPLWVSGSAGIPAGFVLEQNYPNPFNPSTTISYALSVQAHVRLTVFDLLGREVARLVDGIEAPGQKSVRWEAASIAAGVYFYRLQVGEVTHTRKMILMK